MNAPASLPIDPAPAAPRADLAPIETIVGKLGRTREQLIPILQAIQAHYRYLPKEALERVCALTEITPAQLVSVATFYKQFRHTPCGKHLIRVCHGTACHVSGAGAISEAFEKHLHLPPGQSTDAEGAFTLEKVACLGCCSLAPAVQIDDGVYGNLTPGAVPYVLEEVRRAEKQGSTNGDRPSRNGDGAFGEIRIALDSCCLARGADKVFASLQHVAVSPTFNFAAASSWAIAISGIAMNAAATTMEIRLNMVLLLAELDEHNTTGIQDAVTYCRGGI